MTTPATTETIRCFIDGTEVTIDAAKDAASDHEAFVVQGGSGNVPERLGGGPGPWCELSTGRWEQITCAEREALIDKVGRSYNGPAAPYTVFAGRSDLGGQYGEPQVFTEWGNSETGKPLLRDRTFPGSDKPCEHHRFTLASA